MVLTRMLPCWGMPLTMEDYTSLHLFKLLLHRLRRRAATLRRATTGCSTPQRAQAALSSFPTIGGRAPLAPS